MPRTIRFHLDENCDRAIAEGLRRRGIDVTTTPDVGLMSASDEQQVAHSLAQHECFLLRIEITSASMQQAFHMPASPIVTKTPRASARSSMDSF
jgi:hypothetical protein